MADTSAWVEYLRATESDTHLRLRELLRRDELATTDVVLMELLAGARDARHGDLLRGLLARCEFLATNGPRDYEDAAAIFRACRRAGETLRGPTDCLIASVAIRHGVAILHADADFLAIARHTALHVA